MRRIAVLLNPRSGSAPAAADLSRMLQSGGVDADLHTLPPEAPAAWIVKMTKQYDVLAAAGGDGTISAVAAAVIAEDKTLAVLPAGTLNHFARDAGIPAGLEEAIGVLRAGHTTRMDVGVVEDRIFLNNVSVGAYPRMVWERNKARRRGWPRAVASAFAIAGTWFELRTVTVRLVVDGAELVRRSPFVVVGNGAYEVEGLQVGKRQMIADDNLSLYVAPELGRLDALAIPLRIVFGRLKRHEKFEQWRASSIRMDLARRRAVVAVDGEVVALKTPMRFRLAARALRVIVPGETAP